MKLSWKREIIPLAILAIMTAIAIYYYPLLPNPVPDHFDFHGTPDGWMEKARLFLMMGTIFVSLYLLLTFLPFIDPKKSKIEIKFKTVLLLRDALLVFFAVMFSICLQASREGQLNVDLFGIAFALLFIIIGNYMPKVPQNWFVGIKTPWTISSEVVWKKTHILGGWLFILAGVFYLFCVALKINSVITLSVMIITPLISVPYSFFLYKKIEKEKA